MAWKNWEAAAEHGPWRIGIKLGFGVLVFILLVGGVTCAMNPMCQASRIARKTLDADNVLYNYEWFRQRNQDVKALNAKIDSASVAVSSFVDVAGERSGWHREDREEWSRLNSIWLGLGQQRNDIAAEYNARASMANRSIFKGDSLPDSISIERETP